MTAHTKDVKHRAAKAVKDAVRENTKDLVDVRGIRKSVLGLARNVRHASADAASDAMDYVTDQVDDLKSSGVRRLKRIEMRIKAKPGQSVAIAFTAGLLTSFIWGARKDS